jgi:hypothetical protein
LLWIKVKLSNHSNSNLLCYKKPWYHGKNPNLAVKFGFQGDGTIFAKNYCCQNNNFKIIVNKNNIFSEYLIKQSYKFELSQNYLILSS